MDLTKTGKIYDLERFKSPMRRRIPTERSINQENSSLMDNTTSIGDAFETRGRFEQVFLASPRAQELYSSLEKTKQGTTPQKSVPMKIVPDLHIPTPQKSAALKVDSNLQRGTPLKLSTSMSVAGFDEVVNMAEFFHRKTSHRSISCSGLSDPSLSLGKPRTFTEFLKDNDFQVSPFKPSVNDGAIRQKVQMVLNRLEDDSAIPLSNSKNRAEPNALLQAPSRDSGFTDLQSDSGGSSEGVFTDVRNRGERVSPVKHGRTLKSVSDVNNAAGAQTVKEGEEVHISFESNSSGDEEIDVMTEDVQADNDDDDNDGGHDNSKSVTLESKEFSIEQIGGITRTRKTEANMEEKLVTRSSKDTPKSNEARKGEIDSQEKPEAPGTNEMETSHSSMSSEKEHNQDVHKTSKIYSLSHWSLKALKTRTHMGVIVEGQRSEDPEGELWHSTAIVSRLNSRCVQTKSGSQYKLVGPVNDKVTLQQGFPPEFVNAFKNGFPHNWLSLVADFFNSQSSSESENGNQIQEQAEKKSKKGPKGGKSSAVKTPTPNESRTKKKNKTAALTTPKDRQLPREVEVKTTRSGRMVKPPLAWWRGQRIVTDRDHNLEAIDPGGVEWTSLSPMYNLEIKFPLMTKGSRVQQKQTASGSESSDSLPRKRNPKKTASAVLSNSSERDTDETAKTLFFSPKRSPDNNQIMEKNSSKKQAVSEGNNANVSKVRENRTTKSIRKSDLIQRCSVRELQPQEHEMTSEGELQICVSGEGKNTSTNSVVEEGQNHDKRKTNAKPCTDSECEVVEQAASTIPSPPKRVLRSRKNKLTNTEVDSTVDSNTDVGSGDSHFDRQTKNSQRQTASRGNIIKTSDSENKLSSCDERSDDAGDSGKVHKATTKRRNLVKRLVHKRIDELAKETSSQSSEEDSDEPSSLQSKKGRVRPRSAKAAQENVQDQITVGNDLRVESASSKRKAKTGSDSERALSRKQALKVFKQPANKKNEKRQDEMSDEVPWTDEEIKKLNEALYAIPGNTPMFWQKVSSKVGTRTAEECLLQHQGQIVLNKKDPSARRGFAKEKKDPGQKAASQQNVKAVTGGVGTIKRKRELRELLEQQDVNYEDDIFDSTPFKKKKDLKLPFNLSSQNSDEDGDDDDDDDDDEGETVDSTSYKTPSSRTPSSRYRPLGPLPISTTPGTEFISPSLLQQVNRRDMDHYIYRMQQGKRGMQIAGKQKSKPMRTSTPKKSSSSSGLPTLGSELFEVRPASDRESEEDDQDYYFSDE